ncbi:Clan MH, family M20, peptidase T-like metallopeptidase [Carpediemonas membranifera]|uniref:Clan MH, family M20, peptidase T-like metallopeptidase n=1 Tax=Carpediemonas membranifera TaxID=201153 RepID=A0A8J6E2P9_9EUKA|nr:Clan MH, family M20, peptidase T-like metallopeptidase [Carpediemonas membranifera]|eukprot:KAG9394601.1 Clan MH, family M20, peptidase T-like metallopeptidase [Carpediemonas membranifera]
MSKAADIVSGDRSWNSRAHSKSVAEEDPRCLRRRGMKGTAKTITDEDITANPLLKREPYVGRWIFSTDGVGCYRKADECSDADTAIMKAKGWQLDAAGFWHPPMLGLGAGHEQHTHRIGEFCCTRELKAAISWMARYPSQLAEL